MTALTNFSSLTIPTVGGDDNTWGDYLNAIMTAFANQTGGFASVSLASGDVTVSDNTAGTSNSYVGRIKLTGTLTANRNLIVPASGRTYVVWNATSASYTATVKTASGTGIAVPQSTVMVLMCDGTNVVAVSPAISTAGVLASAAFSAANASDAVVTATGGSTAVTLAALAATEIPGIAFGIVADDSTDNATALAAIATYLNTTGGTVRLPRGSIRTSAGITITSVGGRLLGEGSGFGEISAPVSGAVGTIIRHTATTGNTITLDTARDVTIRDISFWPVNHKTSGAEIDITDRSTRTLVECITINYPFVGIRVSTAVFTTLRKCEVFAAYSHGFVLTGEDAAGTRLEGCVLDDCTSYIPAGAAGPEVEDVISWATSTAVTVGKAALVNGILWQCISAGTTASSGSGPAAPTWTTSASRTTTYVTDGTAQWRWIGTDATAGGLIDGPVNHVILRNCYFNTGIYSVWIKDSTGSGTSRPEQITLVDHQGDHTYRDLVRIDAGLNISIRGGQLESSSAGRGVYIGASVTGDVSIDGTFICFNALEGIYHASGATGTMLRGVRAGGNSRASVGSYAGVRFVSGSAHFSVVGCHLQPVTEAYGGQSYGLLIDSGCTNYAVTGNRAVGNGTAGYSAPAMTATERFEGNVGTGQPVRPRFAAFLASNQTNVTGDSTQYTVVNWTEQFDESGAFNPTTGVFTAPQTGDYMLIVSVGIIDAGSSHTVAIVTFDSPGNDPRAIRINPYAAIPSSNGLTLSGCDLMRLTAGDTVSVYVTVQGGAKTVGLAGGSGSGGPLTRFQGYLVA